MKGNTRAEILEAWDNGQEFFWFWNEGESADDIVRHFELGAIAVALYETVEGITFDNCSIKDPRPAKKTRKMTPLEMAYLKGDRVVFGVPDGTWWTDTPFNGDTQFTHYAEILDKGKRLGPWKPLEVEE
jgi:hypothetical protein